MALFDILGIEGDDAEAMEVFVMHTGSLIDELDNGGISDIVEVPQITQEIATIF